MKPSIVDIEQAKDEARCLSLAKIEQGEGADEFVEIGTVDGCKVYIAASFGPADSEVRSNEGGHANERDCFLAIFEGSVEYTIPRRGRPSASGLANALSFRKELSIARCPENSPSISSW